MPVFDVIKIDLNQLHKVVLKKQEMFNSISGNTNRTIDNSMVDSFTSWKKEINRLVSETSLNSTKVVYV